LIHMFMAVLLAVVASAFTTGVARAAEPKALNPTSAFRSDTTLRFMHKVEMPSTQDSHLAESSHNAAEAARAKLCKIHGFKVAERAGCVAFMRQACRDGKVSKVVAVSSCLHFFEQEQPGFSADSTKLAKKTDSKKESEDITNKQSPGIPDSLQEGPNYDSKKAQKSSDKVADAQKDQADPGIPGAGVVDAIGDAIQDIQKGPNYEEKPAKQGEQVDETEAPEKPEEKESPSVPGCRNFPKGWEDKKGNDCEDYAEGEWCTRHGGYGDAWLDEWGSFEDVATKGKSAKQVCCVCGGGQKKGDKPPVAIVGGAPAGAPSAAPAASPAFTGPILGTKAGRPLQSQGYSGDLVAHEDGETMTDDWGREFGPHAGHRDIKTICMEHPDNEWCSLHGYYDKPVRSAAPLKSMIAVVIALLLINLR